MNSVDLFDDKNYRTGFDEGYEKGANDALIDLDKIQELHKKEIDEEYERGVIDALIIFKKNLEKIDPCEFAMFSLALCKEIAEETKRQCLGIPKKEEQK